MDDPIDFEHGLPIFPSPPWGPVERHLAAIGESLRDWVRRKRRDGIDLPLLRDTHAYSFEAQNGHEPMTAAEARWRDPYPRPDPVPAIDIDGWRAERAWRWNCEGHWLRDPSGQLRGAVQVRFGVVRAVAAQSQDADEVDPARSANRTRAAGGVTCRGQIVLQARLRPMALAFEPAQRVPLLRRAVDAIRATPDPDRSWPRESIEAWEADE